MICIYIYGGKSYIEISILTQLSFISFTCFFYIFILNKNGWLNLISSFNELCNIPNFMLHVSITVTLISLLSLHNLCMTFQLVHNLIRRSFYTLETCYKNKMQTCIFRNYVNAFFFMYHYRYTKSILDTDKTLKC